MAGQSRQTAQAVRLGCAGTPPRMSRGQVFGELDFLEESFLCRDGAPSAKALGRWKREAPEDSGFVLVAPDAIFGNDKERQDAIASLIDAAAALSAEAVILRTPSGLPPSQLNRDRLEQLCASEATGEALGGAARILWPRGLWDPALGLKLAAELDLVLCFDPLANDPLEEIPGLLAHALGAGVGYLRPERIGSPRRRFDPYELETLAEIVGELDTGWVSFAHSERTRDAVVLKQLLASSDAG